MAFDLDDEELEATREMLVEDSKERKMKEIIYKYITEISDITISDICDEIEIERTNVYSKKSSLKVYKKIMVIMNKKIDNIIQNALNECMINNINTSELMKNE